MSHVTTGLKPMPHTMCVKLGALLGTSAEFWATLQMRHDLWHAMQDPATKKTVKAIAPLVERAVAFQPGELSVSITDVTFPAAPTTLGEPVAAVVTDGKRSRVRPLKRRDA